MPEGFEYYLERLGYLEDFQAFPESLQQALLSCLSFEMYSKNEFIMKPGEVCRNIYLILEGSTRNVIARNEKEVTTSLAFEGQVAVSVDSFLEGTASMEGIQALEDTICCLLFVDDYNTFSATSLEFNVFANKIRHRFFQEMSSMLNSLRGMTAYERYEYCMENKPMLVRRVPVRHLASYLGMSHETLSRMRSLV